MSSAAVKSAIRDYVADNWDTSVAAIRATNATFDPQGKPWFEIRFPGAAVDRGDIGEPDAPLWDEVGAIMVDVYVPLGSTDAAADEIGDAIWALLRGQEIEGIRLDGRLSGQSGPRETSGVDGTWWGLSYGITYRYLSVG